MLFITNRKLKEKPRFTRKRKIRFDLDNTQPETSITFCRNDAASEALYEIGHKAFFEELRMVDCPQILLYIHGFNVLPQDAFIQARQLQQLCDRKQPGEVRVVPMLWPTDNDFGLINDYYDDQITADGSAVAFARAFMFFLGWREERKHLPPDQQCLKRINLLAHSMGNRVFRGAIRATSYYFQGDALPLIFRNVFMVAADLVNETLEPGQEGEMIPWLTRNLGIYYAADDFAMRASKIGNVRHRIASKRLGHTGPVNLEKLQSNVHAFNCDGFNNRYDPPMGHGYFLTDDLGEPGLCFNSIFQAIDTGRMIDQTGPGRNVVLGADVSINHPEPVGPRI